MDLAKFAETHRITRGGPAWIETIPEWPEIKKAWAAGIGIATIKAWLIADRGYPADQLTQGRLAQIRNHPRG